MKEIAQLFWEEMLTVLNKLMTELIERELGD